MDDQQVSTIGDYRSSTMADMETVGERLKRARDEKGMSQPELARTAGVSKQAISKIELGHTQNPEASTLEPICRALGISMYWLLHGRPERKGSAANDDNWDDITAYAQAVGLGAGAEAQEYAETNALKFKASSLRKRGIYGRPLAVYYGKGDSMEPTIKNGDAIMFDTSDTRPVDGVLYVVQVGREIHVKRAEILDGSVYFRSDNPLGDHAWRKPKKMDSAKDPIQVLGRVHWIAGWAD
jgi:phage repressor protein C with HTH and peptisase S24 domain